MFETEKHGTDQDEVPLSGSIYNLHPFFMLSCLEKNVNRTVQLFIPSPSGSETVPPPPETRFHGTGVGGWVVASKVCAHRT